MQTIYHPDHVQHNPPHEFMEGALIPFNEVPARAEMIHAAVVTAALGPILPPATFDLAPILAVHDASYLDHLRTVYPRWVAAGGSPAAALPSVLPPHGNPRRTASPLGAVGQYAFDLSAPILPATYQAALTSAACALTGAHVLLGGAPYAYALCRPPGHHAAHALMGGFCYLNNAAIAAHYLRQGSERVAVLDIDVHAGNGTQDIFYDRADVLVVSLHGSPDWEYPYFWGGADERGSGAGVGYNLNYPLPVGMQDAAYLTVLGEALAQIQQYAPQYLVLSAGFDTFAGDPLGKLELTAAAYPVIGARIAALGIPTLVVQEGGYTVSALGDNAVGLLRGIQGGAR